MAIDLLVSVFGDAVVLDGQTPAGNEFVKEIDADFLNLQPDVLIARIPLHLTIGLQGAHEVYILRRPPLH